MVWDISKMFALFSAKYVQTFAMMPTASFPTTVIFKDANIRKFAE